MQKQVEVRMDETQMEPIVDAPEGWCSSFCDKVMKNMVLTLTILGMFLVWLLSLTIYPFATPTQGELEPFPAYIG